MFYFFTPFKKYKCQIFYQILFILNFKKPMFFHSCLLFIALCSNSTQNENTIENNDVVRNVTNDVDLLIEGLSVREIFEEILRIFKAVLLKKDDEDFTQKELKFIVYVILFLIFAPSFMLSSLFFGKVLLYIFQHKSGHSFSRRLLDVLLYFALFLFLTGCFILMMMHFNEDFKEFVCEICFKDE